MTSGCALRARFARFLTGCTLACCHPPALGTGRHGASVASVDPRSQNATFSLMPPSGDILRSRADGAWHLNTVVALARFFAQSRKRRANVALEKKIKPASESQRSSSLLYENTSRRFSLYGDGNPMLWNDGSTRALQREYALQDC